MASLVNNYDIRLVYMLLKLYIFRNFPEFPIDLKTYQSITNLFIFSYEG